MSDDEIAAAQQAPKAGKKAKRKKKRNDEDDEDLDKAMMELQLEHEQQQPQQELQQVMAEDEDEDYYKKKKGKKGKAKKKQEEDDEDAEGKDGADAAAAEADDDEAGGTVKTAAQKKKDKKERQKAELAKKKAAQAAQQNKKKEKGKSEAKEDAKPSDESPAAAATPEPAKGVEAEAEVEPEAEPDPDDKEGGGKKKKKKKKGAAAEDKEEKKKTKGPGKAMLAAMQEALKKAQEEEELRKKEEEERIRREEEAEQARLEKKRLEEERKAAKKLREKEKREQLRKEGKLLTAKQKADKARAEAMLQAMRAQGADVPQIGEKRGPRPGTRIRPKKNKEPSPQTEEELDVSEEKLGAEEEDTSKEEEPKSEDVSEEKEDEDAIKDSWDASDSEGEDIKDSWEMINEDEKEGKADEPAKEENAADEDESEDDEDESEETDEDEEDSDDEEESESDEEDDATEAERRKERALARITQRKENNEKARTTDDLRAPVVCVLGHVDTGKTKILDKLRRTNVQDGEAGGITQQIGATNVPIEVIQEQCKMVKNFPEVKLPGLLIIDTPGHESFSNLRDRGSTLCDIAILVVDIMHSLEPQTIESINLLKKKKTPFVIALNKIDRLYEWKSNRHKDVHDVINMQQHNTKMEFDRRAKDVITAMAEQGLNAALFYENPDPKTYISMVPTSAHSGDGMGNLMGLLVKLSQQMLAKRLMFTEEVQATVLEVKAIPGLGTTIDICLVNGCLKEGQTIVLAGTEGPIVTHIKTLLTPSKMQDLRVKSAYTEHKEIRAAIGVKIAGRDLDKVIAGLNLLVAYHTDEIDLLKEEAERLHASALNAIKVKERGVFVQASTLGSLEALIEFLRTSKIPYAGVKIGPVVKRDVMKASVMLEHEEKYTIILAFDVKVERDAQELADSMGVKIFQADIIYHLFDRFMEYQEEYKRKKREEFKHQAVFPCKLRVLPNCIFNSRDPIVAGVVIEAGVIRQGTPLCVPSKEFLEIGIVTSIESNHKEVETARKGEEVCVKIEPIPGESPKMFGRHFDEKDILVSKISRATIDVCKQYFREDLQKADWQLMVELKKLFQIL